MIITFLLTFLFLQLSSANKVILISLDGFRHDYIEKAAEKGRNVSAFEKISSLGFRAMRTQTVMVSLTFPSHFALATGRNVETHGLVGNEFWDPDLNDSYVYTNAEKNLNPAWFSTNGNEPIWLTNQRHGFKTGLFYWPGSDSRISNSMPYVAFGLYSSAPSLHFRIDRIMQWISQPDINFCMLYFNQPDSNGHKYGPDSDEVLDAVEEINDGIDYLMRRIESLEDQPNLVITSDHGMTAVNNVKIVDVSAALDPSEYLFGVDGSPANLGIWPIEGGPSREDLYNKVKDLKNCKVYLKEDIPLEYHYSNNTRVAPIVIIADLGYMIQTNATHPFSDKLLGMHGYNNSMTDMNGFLVAYGPDISVIGKVSLFYQIDVYPFVCLLLGLTKPNKIDGLPRRVIPYLRRIPPMQEFLNFEAYARGEKTGGSLSTFTVNYLPVIMSMLIGLIYKL